MKDSTKAYRHLSSVQIASIREKANAEVLKQERAREFAEAQELSSRLQFLMGTNKRQLSSHGSESRTRGIDKRDLTSSDADIPDLPATIRSPTSRASSRASKRIRRPQDPNTPTTCAAIFTTTSKEHCRSSTRIGRVPLGSTQGPGSLTPKNPRHRKRITPKSGGADEVPTENGPLPPKSGSDEESFGGGDIFTSTDQQQLSALRRKLVRHDYDETTTEF